MAMIVTVVFDRKHICDVERDLLAVAEPFKYNFAARRLMYVFVDTVFICCC